MKDWILAVSWGAGNLDGGRGWHSDDRFAVPSLPPRLTRLKRKRFVAVALTTIQPGFKLTPMIPFIQSVRSREALNPRRKSP